MLLTIPSFARNPGGWIEYHVFVDTEYQAGVRYRQLEKLYRDCLKSCKIVAKTNSDEGDELRRQSQRIPAFPPKKFFKLNDKQANERRIRLQNWLVALTQVPQSHPALQQLQSFLSLQQQNTFQSSGETDLSIYLLDGSFLTVSINAESDVIKCALEQLNLTHFHSSFALYIMRQVNDEWAIYRKLYKFESAYVSIKRLIGIDMKMRLTLIRDYWNPKIDEQLIKSDSGLNFLHAECLNSYRQNWLIANDLQTDDALRGFLHSGDKLNFVNLCRAQQYYSCLQFGPMFCDYPVHRTPCLVNIGDYKLFIRVLIESEIKQVTIPMRQIKAWRVTKTNSLPTAISIEAALSRSSQIWIEFLTPNSMVISSMLYTMINATSAIDHAEKFDQIDFSRDFDQSF